MRTHTTRFWNAAAAALVAGCSGGGGGDAPVTYRYTTPSVNSQRLYTRTTIDNSNNTISQAVRDTVTAVNQDGSFVYVHEDPSGNHYVVNGTDYTIPTETINSDNTGHILSYAYTSGSIVTCTFAPYGGGPLYPLAVGRTWSLNYVRSCTGGPAISYTESGTVASVESVTVPAGTFSAIRLEGTITYTDSTGTTHTETFKRWHDVPTQVIVKSTVDLTYGGTAQTNGYPVSVTSVLNSVM